jgi:hypothetical protein
MKDESVRMTKREIVGVKEVLVSFEQKLTF